MGKLTAFSIAGALALTAASGTVVAGQENAAIVTKDLGCLGFVPTESGGIGPLIRTPERAHAVRSGSGNVKLTCKFRVPGDLVPDQPRKAEGFRCRTQGELTVRSSMSVTPGGTGKLVCMYKANR